MDFWGFDYLRFWIAVIGAALFKVYTSRNLTKRQSLLVFVFAVFAAFVFAEPIAYFAGVEDEASIAALGAIVALTGEHILRHLLTVVSSKESLIELIRALRGFKNGDHK